uniref:Protein transport protein SEC24 n=1 Tax=Ananas comosus var. bracteatus TaxID=296719 RepID=A0A6V7Q147_ANACO|nr:unnamed protein product [Ananas comosus var. bracteatus]
MAVRASLSRFPWDPELQEACGVPWGVAVTPLAFANEIGQAPLRGGAEGHRLPRCDNCYGYFNTYCELDQWSWTCALCGALNGLSAPSIDRYSQAQSCPRCAPPSSISRSQRKYLRTRGSELDRSSEEFLELIKSALLAALEALAPGSLFGLVTFSYKTGLYDVQGPIPVVKHVFIPPDSDGGLPVDLEDAMPLLSFLSPVESCKDRIAAALETLKPTTSWERTTAAGQGMDGVFLGGRGFGAAMSALVSYLSSEYGKTFALVWQTRVFAFLSGPPDYGAGQLDTRRYGEQYASKGEDADRALLPEQTPFYKDLAAIAVQAGVCVDIFAITNEYTDLASLKFLSIESGGSLFLYWSTDDSTLPQDIYRMLSRPYAFGCVLRLRTSSDFKPANAYGHFFPDPQYENVQHIICCDSFATYAYDFEFESNTGFSRHSESPVLQIAFQYTTMVPYEETGNAGSNSDTRPRYSLQRRLRIRTLQYSVASSVVDLYNSVDPEVVSSFLVHKVISASLVQGFDGGNTTTVSRVDVAFSQCPQLQPIPRLVFALLRNPLLHLHEEGVHPDYRIFLQCLFSALEPSSLQRAIYPVLTSYASPDKQAYPRHSLSRAALLTSGSPIFFLDAFTDLIIYYSPAADASLPFPPPHDCKSLRRTINRLKQERSITPKLTFIRGGHDDATAFENYLIEEQDVDGSGLPSLSSGFVSFLEEVAKNVVEYLS